MKDRVDGIDRWSLVIKALLVVFGWLLVRIFQDGGWRAFGSFWLDYLQLAVVVMGVVFLVDSFGKGPVTFLNAISLYFLVAWVVFAGPLISLRLALVDLASLVVGTLLAVALLLAARRILPGSLRADGQKAEGPKGESPKTDDKKRWIGESSVEFPLAVLAAWLVASTATAWLARPLPVDPGRFVRLGPERSIVPEEARRWEDLRIGLALSGGGYRAAVFHAGVLQALEDLGLRIGNLSTVSGGSIVGAYYAAGGDPEDFVAAVRARRLDLKRRLLTVQNLALLPFPFRVPKIGVELVPWYRFDRLDVQAELLDSVLLGSVEGGGGAGGFGAGGGPELMVAATDLRYGYQIGLLPDGLVMLGEGTSAVFRGAAYEPQVDWDLADKVAVSGAFPMAFPGRPFPVRVKPTGATGRGVRDLLLVDGGVRDNLGFDLLRAADRSAEAGDPADGFADEHMPPEWDLDAFLISDGGAVFSVLEEPVGSLALLPRTFTIGGIDAEMPPRPPSRCEELRDARLAPKFSPSLSRLTADTQFHLKRDSEHGVPPLGNWSLQLDPVRYPEPVLRELVGLLPESGRTEATEELEAFLRSWGSHGVRDGRWSRSFKRARESRVCETDPAATALLPGACEAARLRTRVQDAIAADLDVFHSASTLDDRLPRATIDSLERLGKTLVYYRWHWLKNRLDAALACRSAGDEPAAAEP